MFLQSDTQGNTQRQGGILSPGFEQIFLYEVDLVCDETGLPSKYDSESEWQRALCVLLRVVILVSINVQRRDSSHEGHVNLERIWLIYIHCI